MSTPRRFRCTIPTLTNAANLLLGAATDSNYSEDMLVRLGGEFLEAFPGQITAVTGGQAAQNSKTGDISLLTEEQKKDFDEMERLASGARRTAGLAFPGEHTILHAEFQVGEADSKSLAACTARARLIHTACVKYAAELATKAWIATDTTKLDTAILALNFIENEQDEASDDRLDITDEKIILANTLYDSCLTIQNAARLQFPGGFDSEGNARNLTVRARFLLDSFPPRRHPDDDEPEEPPTPPEP